MQSKKNVMINIRVSPEQAKRLRRVAASHYRTLSGEVRAVLLAHVESEELRARSGESLADRIHRETIGQLNRSEARDA